MSGSHLSKDFFELVKAIGESKSKQEEDRIVVQEIALLKRRLQDAVYTGNTTAIRKRQKEFIIRIMYVEMLGHDASFGYIKAIELVASTNLLQKRVGYLCCSLVLSPAHEFRFMIINQLQRDLKSSNQLEVTAALTAVCKLMTVEMIPAVLPMILDLLPHDAELVRKKAMMALHRFHQLHPDSIADFGDQIRRMLCDRDPSVMGASLCILHDLVCATSVEYKDLVPSFVSILKQIMEHRLPREYDYHRIPAPWIQIRLLKILAMLGQADQAASEGMYEILHDVMRRADTGINVGYAIIYECVMTVTTIYPNSTLLDSAAASISRFISSENHNLKYLGVTGLAAIVKDHPRYATAHQMAVIDCLEDPDETLKRKTLDLLYRMTNPVNVEYITEKLTAFLRETSDVYLRTELVSRITQCAERYAPSNAWYIMTMTHVFELGGDLVRGEVAHNLLRLIAEGSSGMMELEDEKDGPRNDDQDMELRKDAVETYVDLLDRAQGNVPDILVCVMSWVLGEYGYLSEMIELEDLCERLCDLAERAFQNPDETRSYVLSAIIKITAQLGMVLPAVHELLTKYSESRSTDIQQRCFECLALTANAHTFATMARVLPVDASCEEFEELDPNMEFLDAYVQEALETRGASRYCPPPIEDLSVQESSSSVTGGDPTNYSSEHHHQYHNQNQPQPAADPLNFSAYEKPELPRFVPKRVESTDVTTSVVPGYGGVPAPGTTGPWGAPPPQGPMPVNSNYPGQGPQAPPPPPPGPSNPGGVKSVWGPSGFNQPTLNQPGATGQTPGQPGQPPQQPGQLPQQYGQQPGQPQQPGYPSEHATAQYEVEGEMDTAVVPDERQAMASALFGGLPGVQKKVSARSSRRSGASRSSMSKKSSRNPTSHQLPQQQQQQAHAAPQAAVDLLDFGSPDTAAPAVAPVSLVPDPFNLSAPALAPASLAPTPASDPFLSMTAGPSGIGSALPSSMPTAVSAPPVPQFSSPSTIRLSPWKITTPEFGSRWGSCKCEKKDKVQPTNIHSLNDYQIVVPQVNLHLVEAIPQSTSS